MDVYNLIIETTRRCNLKCEHCLRGPAQPINMNLELMKEALDQIGNISSVTFSGGESSLPSGLKTINFFLDCYPDFNDFYIVTNAKQKREKFVSTMARAYNMLSDPEITAIDISKDSYHDVSDSQ